MGFHHLTHTLLSYHPCPSAIVSGWLKNNHKSMLIAKVIIYFSIVGGSAAKLYKTCGGGEMGGFCYWKCECLSEGDAKCSVEKCLGECYCDEVNLKQTIFKADK